MKPYLRCETLKQQMGHQKELNCVCFLNNIMIVIGKLLYRSLERSQVIPAKSYICYQAAVCECRHALRTEWREKHLHIALISPSGCALPSFPSSPRLVLLFKYVYNNLMDLHNFRELSKPSSFTGWRLQTVMVFLCTFNVH